ncbi:MAG: hypothetical protein ACLF0G_00225 [Candidatus Brocadiia bacterium]
MADIRAEPQGGGQPRQASPALSARLVLPWAGCLALGLVLGLVLAPQSPDYVSPLRLVHAYRLLVGFELLFLLVAVPLVGGRARMASLVALWAMAAPLVVVCAWVSNTGAVPVAASQAYLGLAACGVAGFLRAERGEAWRRAYWLAVGALGGAAPFVGFVAGDLLGTELPWAAALSPFWVADRLSGAWRMGWEWVAPAAGLAVVTTVLWLLPPGHGLAEDGGP